MNLVYIVYFVIHLKHCQSSKQGDFLQMNTMDDKEAADDMGEVLNYRMSNSDSLERQFSNDHNISKRQVQSDTFVNGQTPRTAENMKSQFSNDHISKRQVQSDPIVNGQTSRKFSVEGREISEKIYKHIRRRTIRSTKTIEDTRSSDHYAQRRQLFLPTPFVENHPDNSGLERGFLLPVNGESLSRPLFQPLLRGIFQKPLTTVSLETSFLPAENHVLPAYYKEDLFRTSKTEPSPFVSQSHNAEYFQPLRKSQKREPLKTVSPVRDQYLTAVTTVLQNQHQAESLAKKHEHNPSVVQYEATKPDQPQQQSLGHNNRYEIKNNFTANFDKVDNGSHHLLTALTKAESQFKGVKEDSKIIPTRNSGVENLKVDTSDKLNARLNLQNLVTADFKTNRLRNETVFTTSSNAVKETRTQAKLRAYLENDRSWVAPSNVRPNLSKIVSQQPIQTPHLERVQTQLPFEATEPSALIASDSHRPIQEPSYFHDASVQFNPTMFHQYQDPVQFSHPLVSHAGPFPRESLTHNQVSPQYTNQQRIQENYNPFGLNYPDHSNNQYQEYHQIQEVGSLQNLNPYPVMKYTFSKYQHPFQAPQSEQYAEQIGFNLNPQYPDKEIHQLVYSPNQLITFYPQSHLSTFQIPQSSPTPFVIIRVSAGPLDFPNEPLKAQPSLKPHNSHTANVPSKNNAMQLQEITNSDVQSHLNNHSPLNQPEKHNKQTLSPNTSISKKPSSFQSTLQNKPLKTPTAPFNANKGPQRPSDSSLKRRPNVQKAPLRGPLKKPNSQGVTQGAPLKKPANIQNAPLKQPSTSQGVIFGRPSRPANSQNGPLSAPLQNSLGRPLTSGIYFDPVSNSPVPLKSRWSDSKTVMSRYASLPCNCDRETYQCSCCVKFGISLLDFHRTGCMNMTYDPLEFTFDMRMIWENETRYNYTVNAKNPPPACINTPVPYLPSIDFCVKFFNIFTPGRNIHMCVDFVTRIEHAEVFVLEFDCFKIGADGFALYKPEDNAGITTEDPDTDEMTTTDDYDEVNECQPNYGETTTTNYNQSSSNYNQTGSDEMETTTVVECMTRPPVTIGSSGNSPVESNQDFNMSTPTNGWCFYFWCDSNVTTTSVPPMQNYPSSTDMSSGPPGSNGSNEWCWYFWCNSTNNSPPQNIPSNSPQTNLSTPPVNSPSAMSPSTPSGSNWCFYFWCDLSSNSTTPMMPPGMAKPPVSTGIMLPEMHYPIQEEISGTPSSTTQESMVTSPLTMLVEPHQPPVDSSISNSPVTSPSLILSEGESPPPPIGVQTLQPPSDVQNATTTGSQELSSEDVITSTEGQPSYETQSPMAPPEASVPPNMESFNATLLETFSNSSTSSFNQTNIVNDSNNFVNVSNFSNSTFSNFSVISHVSNSSVSLYFPSGSSTSFSSSNSSSQSSSSSSFTSTFTASSTFSPLTPSPSNRNRLGPTRFHLSSLRPPEYTFRPSIDNVQVYNLHKYLPPHSNSDPQSQNSFPTPTYLHNSHHTQYYYPTSTRLPPYSLPTNYHNLFQPQSSFPQIPPQRFNRISSQTSLSHNQPYPFQNNVIPTSSVHSPKDEGFSHQTESETVSCNCTRGNPLEPFLVLIPVYRISQRNGHNHLPIK